MHVSDTISGQDVPIVLAIVAIAAVVLLVSAVRRGRISLSDPRALPASILALGLAILVLAAVIAMQPRAAGVSFCYSVGASDQTPPITVTCP